MTDLDLLRKLVLSDLYKALGIDASAAKVTIETKSPSDFAYSHGEADAHVHIVIKGEQ